MAEPSGNNSGAKPPAANADPAAPTSPAPTTGPAPAPSRNTVTINQGGTIYTVDNVSNRAVRGYVRNALRQRAWAPPPAASTSTKDANASNKFGGPGTTTPSPCATVAIGAGEMRIENVSRRALRGIFAQALRSTSGAGPVRAAPGRQQAPSSQGTSKWAEERRRKKAEKEKKKEKENGDLPPGVPRPAPGDDDDDDELIL
ncbi:hypothetical protein B0T16DRAFT_457610 [Cercophora newfieldiana]|uniref:Uncharacterized protein n=1 Tax=Cercophora newfieldiana TaxID=92897 RepID=A0AA39Y5U3_9PEZI|nr:hypothetical protein B0T16DRAFT_457610 [Cercophora newfieldiana]